MDKFFNGIAWIFAGFAMGAWVLLALWVSL